MATEENKALLRRYFAEVHNQGNLAILEEIQDPEYVAHSRRFIPIWRRAFPDWHVTINDLIAEGNQVVTDTTSQGTHHGVLEGDLLPSWFPQPLSPTGKRVEIRGIFFWRISGGKLIRVGHTGVIDWITLLRQLRVTLLQ